jgi:hypothetical protein
MKVVTMDRSVVHLNLTIPQVGTTVLLVDKGEVVAVSLCEEAGRKLSDTVTNLVAAVTREVEAASATVGRQRGLPPILRYDQIVEFYAKQMATTDRPKALDRARRAHNNTCRGLRTHVRRYCVTCFQEPGPCRHDLVVGRADQLDPWYDNTPGRWVFSIEDLANLTEDMLASSGISSLSRPHLLALADYAAELIAGE